ncbi:hypothetical protein BDU57DRAFT_228162 [Ampelomyces quisqualis]|uniref:Uncharacterized protein n=1 Tax=Ampelomyces quisqualis TaxID=50730 RepID=A0A6A5QLL9_AMPQU|nr:hypothetical protein BDU57DRAFT_228162 [Ampelomyces quisqualis]
MICRRSCTCILPSLILRHTCTSPRQDRSRLRSTWHCAVRIAESCPLELWPSLSRFNRRHSSAATGDHAPSPSPASESHGAPAQLPWIALMQDELFNCCLYLPRAPWVWSHCQRVANNSVCNAVKFFGCACFRFPRPRLFAMLLRLCGCDLVAGTFVPRVNGLVRRLSALENHRDAACGGATSRGDLGDAAHAIGSALPILIYTGL